LPNEKDCLIGDDAGDCLGVAGIAGRMTIVQTHGTSESSGSDSSSTSEHRFELLPFFSAFSPFFRRPNRAGDVVRLIDGLPRVSSMLGVVKLGDGAEVVDMAEAESGKVAEERAAERAEGGRLGTGGTSLSASARRLADELFREGGSPSRLCPLDHSTRISTPHFSNVGDRLRVWLNQLSEGSLDHLLHIQVWATARPTGGTILDISTGLVPRMAGSVYSGCKSEMYDAAGGSAAATASVCLPWKSFPNSLRGCGISLTGSL
jgi:hypothetical protein